MIGAELISLGVVGYVEVDLRTSDLVGFQHPKWRSIDVNGDQVLSADIRITQLMNIGNIGTCDRAWGMFARSFVFKALDRIEAKDCFPQYAFADLNGPMGTVVIMNRSSVSGVPTEDQHLYKFVTTNSMPPVVGFFKA